MSNIPSIEEQAEPTKQLTLNEMRAILFLVKKGVLRLELS